VSFVPSVATVVRSVELLFDMFRSYTLAPEIDAWLVIVIGSLGAVTVTSIVA
jgi:hypothetical protein